MKKIIFTVLLFSVFAPAQIDRTKPPAPAPAQVINIADYQTFTLGNGLRVFLIENHKIPVVSIQIVLDYDMPLEGEKAGTASISGRLLRAGTKSRTKDKLDKAIDMLGATVSTADGGVFSTALSKFSNELFELTADVVINADFNQAELDKIKQQLTNSFIASKDDAAAITARVVKKVYYGEGHPYSEVATDRTYEKITLDDCRRFYTTYVRPNAAYLAIVGDISFERAKELVEKYFSTWEKQPVPAVRYEQPKELIKRRVVVVDRPAAVQSVMSIGYPVNLHLTSPDIIQARVANTVLGGGSFRLFKNLRETHGYTYGAYSSLSNDKLTGSFQAFADVRNSVTDSAITQTLFEMSRLDNEPVPESELSTVKNFISGNFAISLENPQTIANFAINIARYGLEKNFYKNYLTNLASVNAAQVQEAAIKYIHPDNSIVVVVGKADEVADKVKQFATDGIVEYYESDGKKAEPKKTEVDAGINGETIIEKYITAVGGREALLAVKDKTTFMTGKMQGLELTSTLYQKAPNKYLMKRVVADKVQTLLFDGTKGVESSLLGDRELQGDDLAKLTFQADIAAIANLAKHNAAVKYLGTAEVNGTSTHKVQIVLPAGVAFTQYYDIESGLRMKEEIPITTPQGAFTQTIEYSNYEEVSGIKFPKLLVQTVGQVKLELTVASIKINTGLKDSIFKLTKGTK